MLTEAAAMVKLAKVDPCGIVTEAGIAIAADVEERVTKAPPEGAPAVSCTVPVPDWPPVMVFGETEILLNAAAIGFTLIVAVAVMAE